MRRNRIAVPARTRRQLEYWLAELDRISEKVLSAPEDMSSGEFERLERDYARVHHSVIRAEQEFLNHVWDWDSRSLWQRLFASTNES